MSKTLACDEPVKDFELPDARARTADIVWFDHHVGYTFQWVIAPGGTVRHAQLTGIDARTAVVINRWAEPYAGEHTVALAPDVLACGSITSHALPATVRSVDEADRYRVCGLCRDVMTELDRASST